MTEDDRREFNKLKVEVQILMRDVEDLTEVIKNYTQEGVAMRRDVLNSIQELQNEISVYKTVIKTVKTVMYIFVAILTLKFGDIKEIWSK